MGGTEQNILYADAALGSAEISQKELRLSIELSLNGFSFSVRDITDNVFLAAGSTYIRYGSSYQRLLSSIIDTFETKVEVASLRFSQVDVIYMDTMFTIVPEYLFDTAHAVDYLSFTMGRDMSSGNIRTQKVENISSVCVFTTDEKIKDYFSTRSSHVNEYHSMAVFLANVQTEQSDDTQIHVNVTEGYMQAVVFSADNQLMVANVYELKDNNSFAYYLLSLCNQLNVDERKTPITFYGSPEEYVRQHDALSRYFINKRFAQRTKDAIFSSSLDWVTQYEYFNTLNI
ncbi:MAG: DUF3822 family protein [Flavobacteriales bacterium]|nr:DUF3822 family protein [Flavobacteriales bacterium]